MKNNKAAGALVVCSGWIDSVTALYWAKRRYKRVERKEAFAIGGVKDETVYEA